MKGLLDVVAAGSLPKAPPWAGVAVDPKTVLDDEAKALPCAGVNDAPNALAWAGTGAANGLAAGGLLVNALP